MVSETPAQMHARHQREWAQMLSVHKPDPAAIIKAHASRAKLTVKQFKAPGRANAHARQECMAELRRRTSLSLPQIGRLLNRDHTTVLHALRAVEGRAG